MSNIKNNFKLTNVEVLFIIVMLLIAMLGGILIFSASTKNRKLTNFKDDVNSLVLVAKNSYKLFEKGDKKEYIVTSSDGTTQGLCITVEGLKANDFLAHDYKDFEGYIVIEKSNEDKFHYGVWLTNKKYVINGYDSEELAGLDLDKGITKYDGETFATKVRQSFTGTSSKNGGTGGIDGNTLKTYEGRCINEKV